jgi:uncharacterized protein (DUF2252 family)
MKAKSRDFPRFQDRQAVLSQLRNSKMAGSAHAYMRGNTLKFYEWLETAKGTLPQGPPIWICGDCHVGNLGPTADADGKISIEIRDFDQTVIGNPAHDLIRLGLSLATAARGSDLPGITTAKMIEQLIEGYEEGLADEGRDGVLRRRRPESVQIAMKRAVGRKWAHLARERIEDASPTVPLGKRFWPLTKKEKGEISELFGREEVRRLVTSLRSRKSDAPVEVLDAAYWVKGCSSLGHLRYAALIGVGKNHSKEGALCLMDIKEAVQAAAPRHARARMPRDNAARVVEGARHLSPALGDRMLSAGLLGQAVVLRELRPQDLKLEIDQLTPDEAMKAARFLAVVVGKAHASQLDEPSRGKWRDELGRRHSTSLDAPSWLWSSIVELMAIHEAAYLEHCRRYATDPETA